jgi:hypothetical protein
VARERLAKEIEELKLEREKLTQAKAERLQSRGEETTKEVEEAKEILLNLGVDLLSQSVQLSRNLFSCFIIILMLSEFMVFLDEGIGETELKALVTILESDTRWSRLHIGGNHINTPGAKAIAESLKENTNLQELDLTENLIDNDGAAALASMLKSNKYLQHLNLSGKKPPSSFLFHVLVLSLIFTFFNRQSNWTQWSTFLGNGVEGKQVPPRVLHSQYVFFFFFFFFFFK